MGYLASSTKSELSFDTARRWLRDCQGGHISSGSSKVGAFGAQELRIDGRPARLLKVATEDGSDHLQLVETNDRVEQYAAPSYCWGDCSSEESI